MSTRALHLIVAVGVMLSVPLMAGCRADDTDQAGSTATSAVVATSPATTAPTGTAARYVATTVHLAGTHGTNAFDVHLPQVTVATGGVAMVRDRFNSGMRQTLTDQITDTDGTTVRDGQLLSGEHSAVTTITDHVVAGVAIYSGYTRDAAHPNNSVATITIDTPTGRPIRLSDVFANLQLTATRLAADVTRIDPRTAPVAPEIDTFSNWVPTGAGIRFYIPVPHALGDYLPVTVPWHDIDDLLRPGMDDTLGG